MRRLAPVLVAAMMIASASAHAGLRPRYGGELVVQSPVAPVELDPVRAWSTVEVALAASLGAPVAALLSGAPQPLAENGVRLRLSTQAHWPDGTAIDAAVLASALKSALERATVSLPPLAMRADGLTLDVLSPVSAMPVMETLQLPWLRLVSQGRGGAFRARRGALEAEATAAGGAPMTDAVRVELYDQMPSTQPNGVVLGRPGPGGRPVVVAPRRGGPAEDALRHALLRVDRDSLVRLFVRGQAQASSWTQPAPASVPPTTVSSAEPLILAVDSTESSLAPVAQRLQVVLRDAGLRVRLVSEPRDAYFARLARQDFDLALAALPPAPAIVQAATALRLLGGDAAAQSFWNAAPDTRPLEKALGALGATLLYVEAGGVELGTRVRGVSASPAWGLDLANAWLSLDVGAP